MSHAGTDKGNYPLEPEEGEKIPSGARQRDSGRTVQNRSGSKSVRVQLGPGTSPSGVEWSPTASRTGVPGFEQQQRRTGERPTERAVPAPAADGPDEPRTGRRLFIDGPRTLTGSTDSLTGHDEIDPGAASPYSTVNIQVRVSFSLNGRNKGKTFCLYAVCLISHLHCILSVTLVRYVSPKANRERR